MKDLLKAAFCKRHHRILISVTLAAMCLLTFASQMEIFALGVLTKKGPAFFELFAPIENGRLHPTDSVSHEQLNARFLELDTEEKQAVTQEDVRRFLRRVQGGDIVNRLLSRIESVFPVTKSMKTLAFFFIFVALFKAVTLFAQRYTTKLIAISVSRDLREQYFRHIQSLPMSFYSKFNTGSLSSRVASDASTISEAINSCLINYIQTPFTVITTLGLCFATSWQLSLIVFLGFPLIIAPIVFLAKKVRKISRQLQKSQEGFSSVLLDFLNGIQTVKVFAMEKLSLSKYKEMNDNMAQLERKSARYDLSSRPVVHTIAMFFLATTLIYGLYVLQMSIPELFFYCGLLYVFYEPIKKFAEENSRIQKGIAAADRMQEVLAIRPEIADVTGAVNLTEFSDAIAFNDVWFRYKEQWVLKGLSFTIKKGESVAIVGPTGAGKSTIIQLLPRLYDCQSGTIAIDGKPLKHYTQQSLREMISMVPQRPFLFHDTVAANIAFGRSFSHDKIHGAAKNAHAEEFIVQLPDGYQTLVAEAGRELSGGQQQRLAIARALIKGAPILVMDEATSSLDALSEDKIKQAIHELKGKVTQIIIAHRLTTIEDADRILYVEDGRLLASGTIEELLVTCPEFCKLWQMRKWKEKTPL